MENKGTNWEREKREKWRTDREGVKPGKMRATNKEGKKKGLTKVEKNKRGGGGGGKPVSR